MKGLRSALKLGVLVTQSNVQGYSSNIIAVVTSAATWGKDSDTWVQLLESFHG